MTTRVPTPSPAVRAIDLARDWLASRRHQAIAALVLYAAVAIGYFGPHVLPHLGRMCVCPAGATDPAAYMWNQVWWPHALLRGMNPFITSALFAPDRIIFGGQAAMAPAAGIAAAPVTLLFGPVVSYNLLMLASPVLEAFLAFLLYMSGSFAAGLFGGYLFGFSA